MSVYWSAIDNNWWHLRVFWVVPNLRESSQPLPFVTLFWGARGTRKLGVGLQMGNWIKPSFYPLSYSWYRTLPIPRIRCFSCLTLTLSIPCTKVFCCIIPFPSGSSVTMHLAAAPHHPTATFLHPCMQLFQDQSTSLSASGPLYAVCQSVVGEPPSCCEAASLVPPDAAGNTHMLWSGHDSLLQCQFSAS